MWIRDTARLAALLLLAGCSVGPERIALPAAEPVPASRTLEVWRGTKAAKIVGVRFDIDSIRGRPAAAADCDSCIIAIANVDIDSVRLARHDRRARLLTGVPIGALTAFAVVWGLSDGE